MLLLLECKGRLEASPWDLEHKMVQNKCVHGSNLGIDFICLITGKEFWVLKSEFFFNYLLIVHKNRKRDIFFVQRFVKDFQLQELSQEIQTVERAFKLVKPNTWPLVSGLWVEFSGFPHSAKQKSAPGIN